MSANDTILICKSRGFDNQWLFEAAKEIRISVFVGEQNVPLENEQDEQDAVAEHVVAFMPVEYLSDPASPYPTPNYLKSIFDKSLLPQHFQVIDARECSDSIVESVESGRLVPVATSRAFLYKNNVGKSVYKVGRVAVIKQLRARFGAGRLVMQAIEQAVTQRHYEQSENIQGTGNMIFLLHAQTDKSGFYERCGYISERHPDTGEIVEFEEERIMHVKMYKLPAKQ